MTKHVTRPSQRPYKKRRKLLLQMLHFLNRQERLHYSESKRRLSKCRKQAGAIFDDMFRKAESA